MSTTSTSSYTSISLAPAPTATVDASASSDDTSTTRLAMIMSVAIASICLVCFVWQSIQGYKLLGKSKWSQLSVLAFCQCILGTVYSLFTLAAYCLSISCEVRAVAEVIIINISDVLLQVILLHRFYAIKRRKAVLFTGITFIVALLVYVMVALAAGDIQSFMVGNICATGSRKSMGNYCKGRHRYTVLPSRSQSVYISNVRSEKIPQSHSQAEPFSKWRGILVVLLLAFMEHLLESAVSSMHSLHCCPSSTLLHARCVMSYCVLKHLCIIDALMHQPLFELPSGSSTILLQQYDKESITDTRSLHFSRLVELPAPERRDSGMIRY